MEILDILKAAVEKEASDIHLVIGKPPMLRIRGEILPLVEFPDLTAEESKRLIYSILYDDQKQRFEENLELDCSFEVKGTSSWIRPACRRSCGSSPPRSPRRRPSVSLRPSRSWRTCRGAWCWSRGPRVRANPPPSPASSTWSTRSTATTSSPSRTPSSSSTTPSTASSASAKWASPPGPSRTPCAAP